MVTSTLQPPQTLWFIFQNHELLLLKENNMLPNDMVAASMSPQFLRQFHLGNAHHTAYYCAEIHPQIFLPDIFQSVTLRQALPLFSCDQYGFAVKAFSVINWDRNHQFCGGCGALTTPQAKDFERRCTACQLSFFPRISPSIIVLIKKEEHLLMARSPHFPPGVYGLIAGFVNAGESIEEAVHREVKEEVGLTINNLLYHSSQPWPFPDSLMLGFTADYESGEIVMQQEEIEEANWYRYDSLPGLPSMTLSIGMRLIDHFIKQWR